MRISILGDGGWGTALAILLHHKGLKASLWGAFPDYVSYLDKKRINTKFLPQIKIPKDIEITSNLNNAIYDKELIIFAIPSQYLRRVLKMIHQLDCPREVIYLSVIKGIETGSLKRMSEVIHEEIGNVKLAVLSGPTIAYEVAKEIPTTAVIASYDKNLRKYLQGIFMTERFRIYTNDDVIGVELGGSLKNIIAIACGISDGLGFGTNTKAALLSRGLVEISRLGYAMGARVRTFSGISGLGDLVTTCVSPYSRNRFVGEQIGKGKSLKQVKARMQMVAEGVLTTQSAYALSLKYKVDMPITKEVYSVLYKNKSPERAVRDLMSRERKEE
ncbi:MAG: glycerol-3-phosphate dehydrogenase [Candidatus Omnitrophica bacterium CG23_combo_of_CG06-09_8_20_14_all_40_11]|nr:MAG: glycerol-3-phosphate dehydrogenase [Candidatus Omnitrophica bacterium CG23_combo_of_CG06-09_8_20_14_all_40_11]